MNFHMFVLISTVIFYILLRIYKKSINKGKKKQSNLIYVLIVPLMMYLYHFMYIEKDVRQVDNVIDKLETVVQSTLPSESLLTSPFPESSVSIESVTSTS